MIYCCCCVANAFAQPSAKSCSRSEANGVACLIARTDRSCQVVLGEKKAGEKRLEEKQIKLDERIGWIGEIGRGTAEQFQLPVVQFKLDV